MEIEVTAVNQAQHEFSADQVAQAVNAIREDGFVILNDVFDHAHLDTLRERMTADSETLLAAEKWGGAGSIPGHLQQRPPPFAPYVFANIVANPFVIQVTKGVLGEGLYNRFYSGNTNCPDSGTQPVHMDNAHLWPSLLVAHPAASLVINFGLIDIDDANGSTELWPGSHLIIESTKHVDPVLVAARSQVVPSVRANMRKGSALIRDMRVWHRGVPNRSQTIRHMLAMIHNIHWLQRPSPLPFNHGCEAAFAHDDLDPNVTFTDEPIDYLFTR